MSLALSFSYLFCCFCCYVIDFYSCLHHGSQSVGIVERSRSVVIERQGRADACSHAHILHLSFRGYLTADSFPSCSATEANELSSQPLFHTMRNGCDKHGCAGSFGIRVRLVEQLVPHALCVLIGDDVFHSFSEQLQQSVSQRMLFGQSVEHESLCQKRPSVGSSPVGGAVGMGRVIIETMPIEVLVAVEEQTVEEQYLFCRSLQQVGRCTLATSPDEPGKKYTYTGRRARESALPPFPGSKCLFREYAPAE